jgi:hypothetical protein
VCSGTDAVACQDNCPQPFPICCNGGFGAPCTPTDQGCFCINIGGCE